MGKDLTFHMPDREKKIRFIAFYLPQYHPIPENDKWWGKGFTEWTNVTKAKPLFKGHIQPKLPGELGYYDLRLPEAREAQAELARSHGIEGFCYWHYWFGNGKRILEKPFDHVLTTGNPDFPFCLAWANETWSGIWHGAKDRILIEQTYPGKNDYINHFNLLSKAFRDQRYITINGKPLFIIYKPLQIPDLDIFLDIFRNEADRHGFKGIHIAGYSESAIIHPGKFGLDSLIYSNFIEIYKRSKTKYTKLYFLRKYNQLLYILKNKPINTFKYSDAIDVWSDYEDFTFEYYPVAIPNWDNSPRSGINSMILTGSSPELFRNHLSSLVKRVIDRNVENRIVFLKSWNEWAEGNHLEPDQIYHRKYLEIIENFIFESHSSTV